MCIYENMFQVGGLFSLLLYVDDMLTIVSGTMRIALMKKTLSKALNSLLPMYPIKKKLSSANLLADLEPREMG